MSSTNSLLLRRRHHWLPGFHHLDSQAATLPVQAVIPRGVGLCADLWLGGHDSELDTSPAPLAIVVVIFGNLPRLVHERPMKLALPLQEIV